MLELATNKWLLSCVAELIVWLHYVPVSVLSFLCSKPSGKTLNAGSSSAEGTLTYGAFGLCIQGRPGGVACVHSKTVFSSVLGTRMKMKH